MWARLGSGREFRLSSYILPFGRRVTFAAVVKQKVYI
jgi:hypothetical protein